MEQYQLHKVTMDYENFFSAYVIMGEDWNGFAMPYFTLQEARRLCEYLNTGRKDEWIVVNLTDGIIASETITKVAAEKFIKEFPLRFKERGYYLTSNSEKIKPEDVRLEIKPANESVYDEKSDTFIIQVLMEDEENEPVQYTGEDILVNEEKIHVYPIGTGCWIWSIATRLK